MKLNKNQRKFFIEAVNHFGEKSLNIRLKDLSDFASNNDLILPTSALKKYCSGDDLGWGHYNLQLTGITPDVIEEDDNPPSMPEKEFKEPSENIIIESSSFVDYPSKSKMPKMISPYVVEKGQEAIRYKRPVYIVSNSERNVISVHESPKIAFERRERVLHDRGLMTFDDFMTRMMYVGGAVIPSSTSTSLSCLIEVMELES